MPDINLPQLLPYAPLFWSGLQLTLLTTACAIVLSFPLGLIGALARVFSGRPVRVALGVYVEVLRNVPFLVVLYIVFFGLPSTGVRLSGLESGILALTLNSTAYTIEIFRGGLAGIPSSQFLAATSLGMRPFQVFKYVIWPQLVRVSSPALGNQVAVVLLGSSLVSTIGVGELIYQALSVGSETFRYFEAFIVVGVLYVVSVQFAGAIWRLATVRLLHVRWARATNAPWWIP